MATATKVNQYEGMFLLGPSGADAEKAVGIAKAMVEKHGGTLQVIKKWDERKLAFEIKKQKRGTYVIAFFTAPSTSITPLEREVKLSEEVLRVLITRAEHLNQDEMNAVEPQPIAPPPERNPWDRDGGGYGMGGDRPERSDRGPRPARGPRREETADAGAAKD
jgi:small subunit ribosomal protein S6